jgi:hypothetical protein
MENLPEQLHKKHVCFMDYYNNDPEYRKIHVNKMMEKVECKCCNVEMSKGNLSHHRNTQKHKKNLYIYDKKMEAKEGGSSDVEALNLKLNIIKNIISANATELKSLLETMKH